MTEANAGGAMPPDGRLSAYHEVETSVPVGRIPLERCYELQQAPGLPGLGPECRYDQAWLQTETFMAMIREGNPDTGIAFAPHEVKRAKELAKQSFRQLIQDGDSLPNLRARAALGYASVDQHEELARGKRSTASRSQLINGVRAGAKNLLLTEDRQPEDDRLLRVMTAIAILSEFAPFDTRYLPAPVRQPWDINLLRWDTGGAHISVGDDPVDYAVTIRQSSFGDDLWGGLSGQPHATLITYLGLKTGVIASNAASTKKVKAQKVIFKTIAHGVATEMRAQKEKLQPRVAESDNNENHEPDEKTYRPEIIWYTKQPAGDLSLANGIALAVNVRNLERLQHEGELNPKENYPLGWMQIDEGQIRYHQAMAKRKEAESIRLQGSRVSRHDAKDFMARADAVDEESVALLEAVSERFDDARRTMDLAVSAFPEQSGHALDVRLDTGAIAVYKALFTDVIPDNAAETIQRYSELTASLFPEMQKGQEQVRRDLNRATLEGDKAEISRINSRKDSLFVATARAAFILLVSANPDETLRNLALPVGFRSGSVHGEVHATIFPVDYFNQRYDKEKAVNIRLVEGGDIAVARRRLDIGMDLLFPQGNPMALFKKLAKAALPRKPGAKVHDRGQAIDGLALQVADATNDALEL